MIVFGKFVRSSGDITGMLFSTDQGRETRREEPEDFATDTRKMWPRSYKDVLLLVGTRRITSGSALNPKQNTVNIAATAILIA